MYRRLAEVRTDDDVDQIRDELDDRYGEPPVEVASLLLVARFRARARQAGISEVTIAGRNVRFAPVDLPESRVVRLNRLYPRSIVKTQVGTLLVPRPQTRRRQVIGGRPIDGVALLEWARTVIDTVIDPDARAPAAARTAPPAGSHRDPDASAGRSRRPVGPWSASPRPACVLSGCGSSLGIHPGSAAVIGDETLR